MNARIIAFIAYSVCLVALGFYLSDSAWQSKYDQHLLTDSKERQVSLESTLKKQQALQTELEKAYDAAKTMQDDHKRNVANADSISKRLQLELDKYKNMPKSSNTSTIAERANAATDRVVLANLLAISDARAGEYAKHADELRQAVINCNNEYNSVRAKL